MQTEVLLNNKRIDLPTDSQRTYQFESPIFKSIQALTSNRSYQFEIPLTERNKSIIDWCFEADIVTDLPYQTMTYEERRGGVTFIKGVATIQQISKDSIYLTVAWGNTLPMLTLKDVELQEMENEKEYISWDNKASVLRADSKEDIGFLLADYGRGIPNSVENTLKQLVPAVNIAKIIALIETHTRLKDQKGKGLQFIFPERLQSILHKTWFPFVQLNANEITWEMDKYRFYYTGRYSFRLTGLPNQQIETSSVAFANYSYHETWASHDWYGPVIVGSEIKQKQAKIGFEGLLRLKSKQKQKTCVRLRALLMSFPNAAYGKDATTSAPQYFEIEEDKDGYYRCEMPVDLTIDQTDNWINLGFQQLNINKETYTYLNTEKDWEVEVVYLRAIIRANKVQFGDRIPVVANLPKMKITAFIQAIMSMYALFPYIDHTEDSNIVRFYALEDILEDTYTQRAIDWSDKIINSKEQKVSFSLDNYANKNYLNYTIDDTSMIDPDLKGYLTVLGVLDAEKEWTTLPFCPSDYVEGIRTYAQIKLWDVNDEYTVNSVKPRILYAQVYKVQSIDYLSLHFPKIFNFGGDNGLLESYYKKYQTIIRHPYIRVVDVYLNDIEQLTFKELKPIQINGIYYLPLQVLMQGNVAEAKLIRIK